MFAPGGQIATIAFRTIFAVLFAFAAALPWGLGPAGTIMLPMLGIAMVAYWLTRDAIGIPVPVVFLSGLLVDTLTGSPLGYWALLFVAGSGLASLAGPQEGDLRRLRSIVIVAGVLLAVAAISWLVASLYFVRFNSPWSSLIGTGIALLVFVPVALTVEVLETILVRRTPTGMTETI